MNKNILLVVLPLIVLALIFLILIFIPNKQCLNCPQSQNQQISQVCFEKNCFEVEVAATPREQTRGLMFRERLEENKGMLFIFDEEGNYGFWMKNMLIPLDIIWLNKNKEIVFIEQNVQPCKPDVCPIITPNKAAQYVLEINAGLVDKIGIKTGNTLLFY